MATIKEIAAKLGLSPSTVSIVLAGQSETRKISASTTQRVLAAAREMQYQPSIAARSLRSGGAAGSAEAPLMVAVFWADDFRASMMVRFLRGLRQGVAAGVRPIRLILYTYTNGQLAHESALTSRTECHAAIVCNASPADQEFLENTELPIPVVLYNRYSDKYATVNVDDEKMGLLAAQALAGAGCASVGILTSPPAYPGMALRTESFARAAARLCLQLKTLPVCDNSLPGGFDAIISRTRAELPDGLFCGSDNIALGVFRALWEKGIRVPQDMRVVAIGNSDRDSEEYAIPSLSAVYLPMEKMASECLLLLLDVVSGREKPPCSREIPVHYVPRESCCLPGDSVQPKQSGK